MKWDCPKRPKDSPHPPRAQVATVDQSHSARTTSDEVATLVQRLEQLGFSRADMTSQPQTPRATLAHPGMTSNCFIASKSSWIVDSGATDHMTGNKSILSGLATTSQPPVQIANGSTCNIEGIGSTQISQNMPLSSVLYVPSFSENLMSVSKITEQLYCSVTFTPTKCTFQELGTNRLIGTAYKDKGLYCMESSPQRVAYLSTSSAKEVHYQLGHPSLQVLKKIRPEFHSISELVCESCI
jgi:hypothetical protein